MSDKADKISNTNSDNIMNDKNTEINTQDENMASCEACVSKENSCCSKQKDDLNSAGGQAVLEGVMMRTQKNYAIAVRKESGEIVVKQGDVKSIKDKMKFLGFPFIRGTVNMIESLMSSFKTLEESAEMAGIEFEEEPSKFEKWLEKKFGKSIISVITIIAAVLGVVLALFLFMYLPAWLAQGVEFLVEKVSWSGRASGSLPAWAFNIIEGVFKIVIFIVYIALSSRLKDIKRVYQYHGAEHKTIFCYENREELTIENVKKHKRFHPRCGTSFIFVILIISIAVMTCATTIINMFSIFDVSNKLLRTLLKLLLLPLTIGIGYEFIRYAGRHNNIFTKILSAPGLWMQRITTKEPDDSMIEVAIVSLKSALPNKYPVIEELERQKERLAEEAKGKEDAEAPENTDNAENTIENTESSIENTEISDN